MRKLTTIIPIILAVLITMTYGLATNNVQAAPACSVKGSSKAYQPITIECQGPNVGENNSSNPFMNYRMTVTVAGSGKSWKVPGYFAADGDAAQSSATNGNVWRAHFVPPTQGNYTYTVAFRQGNEVAIALNDNVGNPVAPNGTNGSFNVGAPDSNAPGFYAQGKLRYVGKQYLRFDNGEYFIKGGPGSPETFLGITDIDGSENGLSDLRNYSDHVQDWKSGQPTWKNGKGKGVIGAVNYLVDTAKNNSIYVITLTEGGDGNNVWPWPERAKNNKNNIYRYDVSKLAQWNIIFEYMTKKGMHLHILTTETETEQFFEHYEFNATGGNRFAKARKLYYRELIARFGHHNITWDIGEEYGGNSDGKHGYPKGIGKPGTINQVKLYADYIKAVDPYNSPVVIHTIANNTSKYNDLYGHPTFDGLAMQHSPNRTIELAKGYLSNSKNAGRQWIFSSDEQGSAQEANPCDPDNRADERRDVLWGPLHVGSWGVEWYGGYQTCGNDFNHRDFRDRASLYNETGHAITYFMNNLSRDLGNMSNNDSLLSGESSAHGGGRVLEQDGEVYSVYLPDASPSGTLSVANGSYTQRWFNPRSGAFEGATKTVSGSSIALGSPPSSANSDWVVLLKRSNGTPGPTKSIPGKIEAEAFDGQSGIQTEPTRDNGGGQNIGFINNGDYADYQVNVSSNGTYQVKFRVATDTNGGTITIKKGSQNLGSATVSNTGGWQNWQTVSTNVNLSSGDQTLRLQFTGGGGYLFNINWMEYIKSGGNNPTPTPGPNPTTKTFTPTDDAYLESGTKQDNNLLRVEPGRRVAYLKFNVSGVSNVTDAKLKLQVNSDAGSGTVRAYEGTSNNWTEGNLSNNNAPGKGTQVANRSGAWNVGTTYTLDVDSLVSGNGTVTVILEMDADGNDAAFSSSESATPPQLVITSS